jgi:hypothetical protein
MKHRLAVFSTLALLVACQGKTYPEQSLSLPGTTARIVVTEQPYGGGPGSSHHDAYIQRGDRREAILSARSLRPLLVIVSSDGSRIDLKVCGGRIFTKASSSTLPYGRSRPVQITAEQIHCE